MVDAAPFRGLRYDPRVAGDPASTSAPAYDELDPHTYTRHRTASPYTALELLAPADRPGSYRAARDALRRWQRTGVLARDPVPAFYRYEEHELRQGLPAVQRGVLAAVALPRPGDTATVVTHEDVDPARVAERLGRLEALQADVSPILALATEAPPALGALLAHPPTAPPVAALSDEAGVDHRVWCVTDPEEVGALREALAGVPVLLADGHHRYAAALAARARNEGAGWQRTLMYVVDATGAGPQVRGVHRLLRGVLPPVVRRLQALFGVEPLPAQAEAVTSALAAAGGCVFGMLASPDVAELLGTAAGLLRPWDEAAMIARLPADRSAAWRALDTAVTDHAVLPALGVGAPAYRTDLRTAATEVANAHATVLLVVRPVDPRVVQALAAEGQHLPHKSTYFRPKPRAGLVLRTVTGP